MRSFCDEAFGLGIVELNFLHRFPPLDCCPFHSVEAAFESVQKECGREKIRAAARRDVQTDKLLPECDQCCISLWASRAANLDDTSGTLVHDFLCLRPPSIENTGIVEARHDRKESSEPTVPLCSTALASCLQGGKPNFDDVRKVRVGFATSAGRPISIQDDITVRYRHRSCTIGQTSERSSGL